MEEMFIRDMSLFRVFTMAMLLVIIIVYVLYLNYLLLGQFFFCLFLAQITSTSLRPYKDGMIKYFRQAYQQTDYLLRKSYIYLVLQEILTFFSILIKDRSLYNPCRVVFFEHGGEAITKYFTKRKEKRITYFNDMKTIIYIVIAYFGLSRIGIK